MSKLIVVLVALVLLLGVVLPGVQAASVSDWPIFRYAYRDYDTSMKYKVGSGDMLELFIYHPVGDIDPMLEVTKCDIFIFIPWNCTSAYLYDELTWRPEDYEWPALFWNPYTDKITIRTEIPTYWKTFFDQAIYNPVINNNQGLAPQAYP